MKTRATNPMFRQTTSAAFRVADILLGAGHAGRETLLPAEDRGIRRVLKELLDVDQLPESLEARISTFDPAAFDLTQAAERFREKPPISHEQLVDLVRLICDADGCLDLEEDAYLITLLLELQLDPRNHRDVVVEDPFQGLQGRLKRAEDIVLGGLALAAAALPMAGCAVAVKLSSPGPVFFKQRRYGLSGREIRVFKFRTMRVAEDGAKVTQAKRNDARITKVGAFLRRTSLDELPQLLNVLRGDMSLVGPRPHAVAHNEKYRRLIREYMLRHKVKPGITGWAQVNGWRGETDTLDKMVHRVEHDLEYIRDWSLWLDAKCLWLTVFGKKVRQNAY